MTWELREKDAEIPEGRNAPHYGAHTEYFTIRMHHHGKFMKLDRHVYANGQVAHFDFCDRDKMSMLEIEEMGSLLGYPEEISLEFLYSTCDIDYPINLEFMMNDLDATNLFNFINEERIVALFVVGPDDDDDSSEKNGEDDGHSHTGESSFNLDEMPNNIENKDVDCGVQNELLTVDQGGRGIDNSMHDTDGVGQNKEDGGGQNDEDGVGQNEEGGGEQKGEGGGGQNEEDGGGHDGEDDVASNNGVEIYDDLIEDKDSEGEYDNHSVGDDSVYSDALVDSDCDVTYDEAVYEKTFEGAIRGGGLQGLGCSVTMPSDITAVGSSKKNQFVFGGFPVFNPKVDMENPSFISGLCFDDAATFRAAVRQHSIKTGRDLKFTKNDKNKVQVKCKHPTCSWSIYASEMVGGNTFQVKTYNDKHECCRVERVKACTSTYLAKKHMDVLRVDSDWDVDTMQTFLQTQNKLLFSRFQMYRVKGKVRTMTVGSEKEQYGLLWRYAAELVRSDKTNTVRIKTHHTDDGPVFKRFYCCWGVLKRGLLAGCRPVICLDGCHLKSYCGGILLSAVGIDANNCMYPFAYAVVEKEKRETWFWFMRLLMNDLQITEDNCERWTIMSDKQKGLIDAVEVLLPHSDHRFCVMHLYNNFKQAHKGLALKNLLWKAARSSRVVDFEAAMNSLKAKDIESFKWLAKRPARGWSRSYFRTHSKCDILLNNICESFNALILQARTKSIVDMLEQIRLILMKRVYVKRDQMKKWKGVICPNSKKLLDEQQQMSSNNKLVWNGLDEFEVEAVGVKYAVNLKDHTCTCRKWQLNGIPCSHSISAMYFMGYSPLDYVDECYKTTTFMKSYGNCMRILHGPKEWPHSNMPKCLPPIPERMPGRPKKNDRKKTPQELEEMKKKLKSTKTDENGTSRLGRCGMKMKCRFCGSEGHNVRTCPRKRALQPQPEAGMEVPAANTEKNATQARKRKKTKQPRELPTAEERVEASKRRKESQNCQKEREQVNTSQRDTHAGREGVPQPTVVHVTSKVTTRSANSIAVDIQPPKQTVQKKTVQNRANKGKSIMVEGGSKTIADTLISLKNAKSTRKVVLNTPEAILEATLSDLKRIALKEKKLQDAAKKQVKKNTDGGKEKGKVTQPQVEERRTTRSMVSQTNETLDDVSRPMKKKLNVKRADNGKSKKKV